MEYYNLTTPQSNIWNLQKYYEGTAIANLCGAVFYPDKRDIELLKNAINQVVEKQTALRLHYVEKNGVVKQYVTKYSYVDIPLSKFNSENEFESYAKKFALNPIGSCECDMYRFEIICIGERVGVLVVLSHLISDAWTFSLIVKETDKAYKNLSAGKEMQLEYADYIDYVQSEEKYFRSEKYRRDEEYWRKKYDFKPEKTSIKASSMQVNSIASKRFERKMEKGLAKRIEKYCLVNSITPAVFFEIAIYCYLFRINPENQKITLGVPVVNRAKIYEKRTAGMFVSTIPLTIELSEEDTLKYLTKKLQKAHNEIFRHEKYPHSMILRHLRETHDVEGNLYDVMFSFQNAQADTASYTKWYSNGCSEVPFVLHIDNRDYSDSYTFTIDYREGLFEEKEIDDIVERILYILEQVMYDDNILVKDIDIVPEREKERILFGFNNTMADYPRDKCVHELFMEQVRKTPDEVAVVFEEKEISYRELDEMSNALAHLLVDKGIGRGDIIPIISKRSWHILVAMLGILKAGAGYMPIAPDYPKDRVQFIINEAGSRIGCVLGYGENLEGIELLNLEELSLENAQEEQKLPVKNRNEAGDVCYVIFTSGSTGVPKGVVIKHSNVVNYSQNNKNNRVCHAVIQNGYRKIISVTNIVFDIFVTESLLPLLNGMTVYLTGDDEVFRQDAINRIITKNSIEVLQTTPTKIKGYLSDHAQKEYLSTLKVIILGGEALTTGLYEELRKQTEAQIFNIYGPAETTVWSSNAEVKNNAITIGRPITNTQIYILDRHEKLVPVGVPGELCVAGEGVGLGYLNRLDLTQERFVKNPFATEENGQGKIMYHTGDLASWKENGEIEYLGRIDMQVKIRGLRIELGEIESVMAEFPGIGMCAVTDKKDEEGRQYLAGYYTVDTKENAEIEEKELRKYLLSKLPRYMIPNYFMCLPEIPMTPSGKTDRKNLPAIETGNYDECLILPQNEIEEEVLRIWKEELHVESLGCNQDFFEVGGDSLLAITLLTQLEKQFNVRLQIKDIFENRTVEELAVRINKCIGKRNSMIVMKKDKFMLTPQQRAVYIASQKAPDTLLYNMTSYISVPEEVDRDRLVRAIYEVFENFQVLRMCIWQDKEGLYGIIDHGCKLSIEYYSEEEKEIFARPFNLKKAPLFRVGFTDKHLLIDMHHIISDGTSLQILMKALQAAYEGTEPLREVAAYSDYAEYLHIFLKDRSAEMGLKWYRDNLSTELGEVVFPRVQESSVYEGGNYYYQLSRDLRIEEKKFCKRYGITETMLHMGVYALLLKSYSGSEAVSGSIIVANRQHFETEKTLGMFVNTLPVTWSFEKKQTVEEYLEICKEKMLKLYEYEEIPFEIIMENLEKVDASVFNTAFVYQANAIRSVELAGYKIVPKCMDTHTAKFDLTVEIIPNDEGDRLHLEYRTTKIDRQLAERMAESYARILLQIMQKEYVNEISALTEEEEQEIIYEFNNTKVDYPRDKCVHELFMEQVKKTPDAAAVVFEEKEISYRKLDEMSNALAHLLVDKGIGRGDIVPIIAKRSWHILVAMLGILKAGAGYMSIAPDYPKDRVQLIINEAGSRIGCVLGYGEKLEGIELLNLEELSLKNAEGKQKLPVENRNEAGDVCYVIFTSGSTGVPKGVVIRHSNVVNYSHNNNNNVCHAVIQDGYRKIISVTNIVFDIFVTESLLPLLNGMTVYLTSDDEVFRQDAINRIITKNGIEVLQTTPTKIKGYLSDRAQKEYLSTLKVIILGGEALTIGLYEELRKQTEAQIFNIYGPAETTVWSSNAEIKNNIITIGKPIANTQIYILDRHGKPVPVGVPGELCIAGEGVGLGYLNRPDLTKERFVKNPFATEENGHGKIMYHTGDLASWKENGEIEYLGRIDTQVKIRGLRIELGEIESVMAEFPGISMCAVTDKKDEEGRQYLAGYYTVDTKGDAEIEEKELRKYLLSKLPRYMVPNYFMCLPEMPMTPSGKTDRKNLPAPEDVFSDFEEYIEPVTELEKTLCDIMEEVLDYRPIGLLHDFFSFGGDSLKAMEFMALAEDRGVNLKLQDIFDYPTVRELITNLYGNDKRTPKLIEKEYAPEKFLKYEPLLMKNKVAQSYEIHEMKVKSVLLTGITGFLGAHIADALLQDKECIIYCLVRSKELHDGIERVRHILEYYFGNKYTDLIETRIITIIGDITDEHISEKLPKKVDVVIHAAATVKHYGSYDYFYKVNTLGTQNIANYAFQSGIRLVHISTISVSGNSLADNFDTETATEEKFFAEDCLYQNQELRNVYVRSKFEAECAILDAMLKGLQANIIRVGNLTNRSKDYQFQPNYMENAFLTRIKAALELGCLPDYILPLYCEFSPVDDTADAIVRIIKHFNMSYTVFHVYSNQNLYFKRLLEILRELSISMKVVDGETFSNVLKRTIKENKSYLYEAFLGDMDEDGKLLYETNIHIQNNFTLSYLKQLGFEWTKIDYEYVKGYIEYYKRLGFLEVNMNED